MFQTNPLSRALFVALALGATTGCASTGEGANRDSLTAHVGVYSPAPPGIVRPRVGVPPFRVDGDVARDGKLGSLASDQLTSLAFLSGRFQMIERAQLDQLLREQGLEGTVRPDQVASVGEVAGVDFLMFGRVTHLRVKVEETSRGFGIGRIPVPMTRIGQVGGFDYTKNSKKITVDCGVDLRIVNPTTGAIVAAHFGEFQKTDFAEAFGVEILANNARADADVQLDEDNKGKVLRLAIDESLRKMLPQVDRALLARGRTVARSAASSATPMISVGGPTEAQLDVALHSLGGQE